MELRMNFTSFIKLKDVIKVNDINGEILEYDLVENEINGVLGINGKYLKDTLDEVLTFTEDVPFTIVFYENDIELDDVDCINLDYHLVDGRGLEISFDIKVEYTNNDDEENIDALRDSEINIDDELVIEPSEIDLNEDSIEEVKEDITEEIQQKLTNSLIFKDDNLPQEKDTLTELTEKRCKLRVCYFSNDNELENVCKNNNISIDQVFKDNKDFDINKYRRVILK